MNKYTFEFEYGEPRFGSLEIETPETNIEKAKELAMTEFVETYPDAIEPIIVRWTHNAS